MSVGERTDLMLGIYVVLFLFAYLMGSLPFGYWFAKFTKGLEFDIRDHGSCSIGFTNVLRILGWKTAIPVFVADFAKGYISATLGVIAGGPLLGGIYGLVSALGHAKSVYFFWKEGVFSGGKSAATLLGVITAVQPLVALVCVIVWGLVLLLCKIVSVSTMVAVAASFAVSYVFGLGRSWHWVFGIMFALILFTHRRNILRLWVGIEPKLGQKSEDGEVRFAFGLHPLDWSDFDQIGNAKWISALVKRGHLTERQMRKLIALGPILEMDEITGIELADGRKACGLILCVPLLPEMIQDAKKYGPLLDQLLRSAAVQAQRRGATVFTLGALLSSYAGGGTELQEWCKKRGLTIVIDNGAAFTVAATIEAIREKSAVPLANARAGIVGAKGLIGRRLSEELEQECAEVVSLAREKNEAGVKLELDLTPLGNADIAVFATSSPDPIVTLHNRHFINPSALVVDVAVPPDVTGVHGVIRSGLILLPGQPRIRTNFHFGAYQTENGPVYLVPACLAQCLILAATGEFQHASRGARLRHENVVFFAEQARKLGLQIVVSDLSEPLIFGKTA